MSADNTLLNAGTGGETFRSLGDANSLNWPVGVSAYPTTISAGANVVQIVDLTHGLPVQPQTSSTWAVTDNGGSLTVDGTVAATQSGTWTVTGAGGTFPVTDSGGSLTIDNAALSVVGGGVEATALRVTLASDSTGVLSIDDNGGSLTVDGTVAISGTVTVASHAVTNAGTFATQAAQSGTWTVQPGNTANTTPWLTTDTPATSGGLTPYKLTSAASTNATSVKGSAGQVYGIMAFNVNAAVRYLKLYNKATAPTVGTDTPVLTFAIPGNTAGAGFVVNIDKGITFSTGIAFALTTEATDAGTTGVAANELTVNLLYK